MSLFKEYFEPMILRIKAIWLEAQRYRKELPNHPRGSYPKRAKKGRVRTN